MHLGIVYTEGVEALAMALGDRWVNITRAHLDYERHVEGREAAPVTSIVALIRAGLFTRSFCRRMAEFVQRHDRLQDYLIPPDPPFLIPFHPGKVVAIGRNYRAHVAEFDNQMPTEPIFFAKAPSACIGPDEAIVVQQWHGRVDHEGELGVLIGKRARNVSVEDARSCIAGYTIVNDVTARDIQKKDIGTGNPWFRSKSIDTFCPLGPVAALADALPWPVTVDIEVRVNGEIRQKSNTAKFIFPIPELIAAVSKFMTLEPGDLIATGTPEGVSPIHDGDHVAVSIPEIGVLRNPVRSGD